MSKSKSRSRSQSSKGRKPQRKPRPVLNATVADYMERLFAGSKTAATMVASMFNNVPPEPVDDSYIIRKGDVFFHDWEGIFARVPRVLASLEQLPVPDRLRRLEEIAENLAAYRDGAGVLDLSRSDLLFVRALVQGTQNVAGEMREFGLNEKIGDQVMMTMSRMIRLYELLSKQEPSAVIDRICQATLTSIARQITSAIYFKRFDEKHMPGGNYRAARE